LQRQLGELQDSMENAHPARQEAQDAPRAAARAPAKKKPAAPPARSQTKRRVQPKK
jgi:hypothetical protein